MNYKRIKERVLSLFKLSKSQRRGVLWLLPLLVVVMVVVVAANRVKLKRYLLEPERVVREVAAATTSDNSSDYGDATGWSSAKDGAGGYADGGQAIEEERDAKKDELFQFDPNRVSLQELCRLGFSVKTAAGIIKYRERGKRFEIPEDFATCYGVTLEHYTKLEPYIRIGDEYRVRRSFPSRERNISVSAGRVDTTVVAENYREIGEIEWKPIEINGADSATLRTISGIGEVLVARVMEYRSRLGGFVKKEQLAEVKGMMEANYERICEQIWVDSSVIQKIDINFASHKSLVEQLGQHPYITDKVLRKMLKQRQLKGGWSREKDMVMQGIMTQKEAEKLAPYLLFVNSEK